MKIAQYLPSKIYQEDPTSLKADDSKRKLLPHIVGEYEYRITNKLLVQKIMKPRRDRIIMQSLANAINKGHKMMESEGGCINLVNNNNRRIRNNIYQTNKPIQSAFIRVQKDIDDCLNEGYDCEMKQNIDQQLSEYKREESGKIKKNIMVHTSYLKNNYLMQEGKIGRIFNQSCRNSTIEGQKCRMRKMRKNVVYDDRQQEYEMFIIDK